MVTPGCSGQGQFPPQSVPAGPQRVFYSFSETSARKCRWRDSVWSAARRGGLPLLRLELARGAAGSKPPAKESGSKLPHSKKDVKLYGTNPTSPLASTKVSKNEPKRTQNELEKRAENTQKGQNEPKNSPYGGRIGGLK